MSKICLILFANLAIVNLNFAHIFSGFFNSKIPQITEEMQMIYSSKILPLEEKYYINEFNQQKLEDGYFDAKPTIIFVGQYSTGKTTLINYLLGQDYPGMQIGPEPTTDRFFVLKHSKFPNIIPGNVLIADPKHKLSSLRKYGNAFFNRLQCSEFNSSLLETMTIIDTPGILSGERKRIDRGYDIIGVFESLSEISDLVILIFDPHKLDISDEFERVINALLGYDSKIRIVLNKATSINEQELVSVYGALMWSLSRIFKNPEVLRVYIGSFWDRSKNNDYSHSNLKLFSGNEKDLFDDIKSLPRNAALRKLDHLIRRSHKAKVHAYIISELYNEMPYIFYRDYWKNYLIDNLYDKIYLKIGHKYSITSDDFPILEQMKVKLMQFDFNKLMPLDQRLIDAIDMMISHDIPRLVSLIKEEQIKQDSTSKFSDSHIEL